MARVLYGSQVTRLTGSIGGTTFQRNQSGDIARSRSHIGVRPSLLQQKRQVFLSRIIAEWNALSPSVKDTWNEMAIENPKPQDFGGTKDITGFAWFASVCLNADTWNEPHPTIGLSTNIPDAPQPFTLNVSTSVFQIVYSPPAVFDTGILGIYATSPVRTTSQLLRRAALLIKKVVLSNPVSTINILDEYVQAFNVNWESIVSTSQSQIVVRMKQFNDDRYFASQFTSQIISFPIS